MAEGAASRQRDRPGATIRCHTHCPCALSSLGDPCPGALHHVHRAQAWQRFRLPAEDEPCSRCCPRRSLCPVPAPNPTVSLAVPWPAEQSPLGLAQQSSEPLGAVLVLGGNTSSQGEESQGCEAALRVRGALVLTATRQNSASNPEREMQVIPSSCWE